MAENQILPFAETDTGENLLSQAEYKTDKQRLTGNQPGVARSTLVNKALKQSTFIAAATAEFMAAHADEADPDVSDKLTVEEGAAYLEKAVSKIASLGGSGLPAGGEAGQALVIGEDGPEWRHVSGDPVGTIIAFAGKEAPKGFLSINYEHETVVPVAAYPALAEVVWCGEQANEDADFFYRCMNADGSVRHIEGNYLVLPAASKYFLRGRDVVGEVDGYQYQGDAIRNITGTTYTRDLSGTEGAFGLQLPDKGDWDAFAEGAFEFVDGVTTANCYVAGSHIAGKRAKFNASRAVPTADENRPINFPVLWCIKAWDAPVNQGDLDVQNLVNEWREISDNKLDSSDYEAWTFGRGQTLQDVTANRAKGVTYINETTKPITVYTLSTGGQITQGSINGDIVVASTQGNGAASGVTLIVPPGMTYGVNTTIQKWWEIR